jgi:VWFA-related protein
MNMWRVIASCVSGLVLAGGLAAAAQQPAVAAGGAGGVSTAASQVVLPITVRDKKGQLVTSLQTADLSLTQDGRPQTIATLTRAGDEPYRIGLLVDTSRAMSNTLEAERKAAEAFLVQVLPDGTKNQAFLIHFDREVELLDDFTSDKSKLDQDLDEMGSTKQQRSDDEGPETNDTPSLNRGRHNGTQLYDAVFLANDELMKGKTGRKVLVVFSNGADRGSKETMNDAVDAADRTGVEVFTIFMKGEAEKTPGSEMPGNNRRGGIGGGYPGGGGGYPGGGGGYPGGGGGRRQPEPTSATGADGKKIMQEVARRTGGHAFEAKHTSDLDPIYKLIDEELRGQYLLTYTPDKPDTEGEFHKVAVTPSNKDYSVSTREGYYGAEK